MEAEENQANTKLFALHLTTSGGCWPRGLVWGPCYHGDSSSEPAPCDSRHRAPQVGQHHTSQHLGSSQDGRASSEPLRAIQEIQTAELSPEIPPGLQKSRFSCFRITPKYLHECCMCAWGQWLISNSSFIFQESLIWNVIRHLFCRARRGIFCIHEWKDLPQKYQEKCSLMRNPLVKDLPCHLAQAVSAASLTRVCVCCRQHWDERAEMRLRFLGLFFFSKLDFQSKCNNVHKA